MDAADHTPDRNPVQPRTSSFRYTVLTFALTFVPAFMVFGHTAYPSITWWDSSNYTVTSLVFGVTPPPGSLLLVVLGWLFTRLPIPLSPAYTLNLLASAFGACAAGVVAVSARRWLDTSAKADSTSIRRVGLAIAVGTTIGALAFSFGETTWMHATKFTPYILTALFTAFILWAMFRWWEVADASDSWRWLFLLGLIVGLDFSVHRTNLLLVPGLIIWVLMRRPRVLRSVTAWAGSAGGLLLGLSFHLILIPMAAAQPFLNMGDPSNWSRFYDYISLRQYGGGWLLGLWPRKAPLVSVQTLDLLDAFRNNLFWTTGRLVILGLFSGVLGLFGAAVMLMRRSRQAIAFVIVWLATAFATIMYFNIPEHFFRPFDRHYLPLLVLYGYLMAVGAGALLQAAWRTRRTFSRYLIALVLLLLLLAPAGQLARNWEQANARDRWFTYDWAYNALAGLPPHAIVFSNGENDTWPLLYVQQADGFRTDVHLLNLSLLNTPWYNAQQPLYDPDYPVHFTPEELDALSFRPWTDTTVRLTVPPSAQITEDTLRADSIPLHLAPTIADKYARPQDLVMLRILRDNDWKRPICFLATVFDDNTRWALPYLRFEGLYNRVVPIADPSPDTAAMVKSLLEIGTYRGYDDHTVFLEDVTRRMAMNYYSALMRLADARMLAHDDLGCRETKRFVLETLPIERLEPPDQLRESILDLCASPDTTDDNDGAVADPPTPDRSTP